MELGEELASQTYSIETFKKPSQHIDHSKSREQSKKRQPPRSRESPTSTDTESIVRDHLDNIPSTIYAGEIGLTIHMEQHDVPQTETIQPETIKALYNSNKIKFTINYHSEYTELAV